MTVGLGGTKTIDVTARFAMKSLTGDQLAPPFVVFQMPPPALPANIVFASLGWMAIDRTRPPTLLGPIDVQLIVLAAENRDCLAGAARIAFICSVARIRAPSGI